MNQCHDSRILPNCLSVEKRTLYLVPSKYQSTSPLKLHADRNNGLAMLSTPYNAAGCTGEGSSILSCPPPLLDFFPYALKPPDMDPHVLGQLRVETCSEDVALADGDNVACFFLILFSLVSVVPKEHTEPRFSPR